MNRHPSINGAQIARKMARRQNRQEKVRVPRLSERDDFKLEDYKRAKRESYYEE